MSTFGSMKILRLLPLFFIITGCKFYYTTAEIDQNFKSVNDQAKTEVQKLDQQWSIVKNQFDQFRCDTDPIWMEKSNALYRDLGRDIDGFKAIALGMDSTYRSFKQYTAGKEKIESGTDTWKMVKRSKADFKEKIRTIESEAAVIQAKADLFKKTVEAEVTPNMQVCNVNKMKEDLYLISTQFQAEQKKFQDELSLFIQRVDETIAEKAQAYPAICDQLKADRIAIEEQSRSYLWVKNDLKAISDKWVKSTQGKMDIYSCSSDWKMVEQTQEELETLAARANEMTGSINKHLQSINMNLQKLYPQAVNSSMSAPKLGTTVQPSKGTGKLK